MAETESPNEGPLFPLLPPAAPPPSRPSRLDGAFVDGEPFTDSPLAIVYYGLRGEGYVHNVALWAAWIAHPDKTLRQQLGLPDTQKEFAAGLGVSPRTIRKYPHKHPALVSHAHNLIMNSVLSDYLPGALKQMGESASQIAGSGGHQDRRLLFEMLGVYAPKVKQELTGKDGEPLPPAVQIYLPDNGRDN
jgi:hypothetical protein